jgi:integrase
VWVLDINDKEEKKTKSKAGKRLIPLHPVLINELGFVDYVQGLLEKGEKRLFPELSLRRDGYGQTASKWFQRYRARCGVVEEGKVFHSFRHTFDDTLKQNLVNDSIISELMGHSEGSLAMRRYADPFRPEVILKEAIMKLDFGIDLSHLKKSKYVAKKAPKRAEVTIR